MQIGYERRRGLHSPPRNQVFSPLTVVEKARIPLYSREKENNRNNRMSEEWPVNVSKWSEVGRISRVDRELPSKKVNYDSFQYIKILTPHIILVSVLIGYLCLGESFPKTTTIELQKNKNKQQNIFYLSGAWILMLLETDTELQARSKKLVR